MVNLEDVGWVSFDADDGPSSGNLARDAMTILPADQGVSQDVPDRLRRPGTAAGRLDVRVVERHRCPSQRPELGPLVAPEYRLAPRRRQRKVDLDVMGVLVPSLAPVRRAPRKGWVPSTAPVARVPTATNTRAGSR